VRCREVVVEVVSGESMCKTNKEGGEKRVGQTLENLYEAMSVKASVQAEPARVHEV